MKRKGATLYVNSRSSKKFKRVPKRRPKRRSGFVRAVRRIALNACETKSVYRCSENNQLNHNVPFFYSGLLYTTQGVGDATMDAASSYDSRIGDEIMVKGIDLRFWLSTKNDRPNTQYRIIVFKHRQGLTINTGAVFNDYQLAAGPPEVRNNKVMSYANTEKITVLKQIMLKSQGNDYSLESGATNRERSRYVQCYLPMKMMKVKYEIEDSTTPKFNNISVCVVAYDAYGTLSTDNIASFAWSYKLYFKDP